MDAADGPDESHPWLLVPVAVFMPRKIEKNK